MKEFDIQQKKEFTTTEIEALHKLRKHLYQNQKMMTTTLNFSYLSDFEKASRISCIATNLKKIADDIDKIINNSNAS